MEEQTDQQPLPALPNTSANNTMSRTLCKLTSGANEGPAPVANEGTGGDLVTTNACSMSNDVICSTCSVVPCSCSLPVDPPISLPSKQLEDPELGPILLYVRDGVAPTDPGLARTLAAERTHYEVVDGVLHYVKKDGALKILLPTSMREDLFRSLHAGRYGAHLGIAKTYGQLRTHYWWRGMREFVAKRCQNCFVCRRRHAGQATTVPMTPIPVGGPFEKMGVDVLQLPKTHSGKKYAVVFVEYLTKWPEVFTTANQEALTIAKLIAERIVPVHGVPKELLSDRGSNFLSKVMYELYRLLGIHKVNTMAYHPRTDGMVERFNRTLTNMLAKTAESDPPATGTKELIVIILE